MFAGTAGTVYVHRAANRRQHAFQNKWILSSPARRLTLAGPTIYTDAGVSAKINSPISGTKGLIKNGPGTLKLTSISNYAGGTTINEGVLEVTNSSLGAAPGSATPNIQINNGATLRFSSSGIVLPSTRQIVLGAGGGVFDTAGNDASIVGSISGSALTKVGIGTLALSGVNSHSGTIVYGGTLRIGNDVNLGATPATFTAGNLTLDGGTLQFSDTLFIGNNRGITLGPGGGTIDTQIFSNDSGYTQANGIQGNGNLTKLGSGTFFMNTPLGQLNAAWKGNLILKEGTWKISERGGLPYNANSDSIYRPGQITFDGGTLQIAVNSISVTSIYRGITIAGGGGTFDTQNLNFTWGGPVIGNSPAASFNKTGSGQLQFNTATNVAGNYQGGFNINGGTVVLNGGGAWGDLSAINLANTAGVGLTFSGGNEVIGSLSGGGPLGGNVANSGVSLTTGGNNNSTTFSGLIAGSGQINKTGTGTFALARPAGNTYTGATGINGGKLLVNNTSGSGTGTGQVIISAAGTLGGTGIISGNVTVLNGGHIVARRQHRVA